jgi:hypothetical protein
MIGMSVFSLFFAPSSSLCESPGINCLSDSLRVCTSASVKYEAVFSEYRLSLYGSFVAKSTAAHTFRIYSDRTSILSSSPSANFVFETDVRDYQKGTWDYSVSLITNWRYYYLTQTDDAHHSSELELSVRFSPGAGFSTLTQSDSDLCVESGCKDMALERRYSCLPSPSSSRSSTAIVSRPFFPSAWPPPSLRFAVTSPPLSSAPFTASNHFQSSARIGFTPRRLVNAGRVRLRRR